MKKLLSLLTITFLALTAGFALPGFTPYIKDIPGEYVWYKDTTFERESYVGFLTFDEATYEARYYSPSDAKKHLPEVDVKIYFTLNTKVDHVELTGERVMAGANPEETEIVNYLHDMLYEFNARRIKTENVAPGKENLEGIDFLHAGKHVRNEFNQFGGDVEVIYDYLVPLFNVKSVCDLSGTPLFFVVTAGRIQTTVDSSFDKFSGFPDFKTAQKKSAEKKHAFKRNKKAKPEVFKTAEGQEIILDSDWSQSMENLWLLGDASLISMGIIPDSVEVKNKQEGKGSKDASNLVSPFILRQLLFSQGASYSDWTSISIENYGMLLRNENEPSTRFTVRTKIWQNDTENLTQNIKIISKKEGGYAFFTLTAFENVYSKYQSYFENIVKSYKN